MIDVEVEQRRLDAEHQHARNRLVVRIALHVRVTAGAGDVAEEGYVRVRGAPYQQQSDTMTATITPLRMPSISTAAKATIDTTNS